MKVRVVTVQCVQSKQPCLSAAEAASVENSTRCAAVLEHRRSARNSRATGPTELQVYDLESALLAASCPMYIIVDVEQDHVHREQTSSNTRRYTSERLSVCRSSGGLQICAWAAQSVWDRVCEFASRGSAGRSTGISVRRCAREKELGTRGM